MKIIPRIKPASIKIVHTPTVPTTPDIGPIVDENTNETLLYLFDAVAKKWVTASNIEINGGTY